MAVGLSKLPKPTSPRTVGGPGFLISWSSLTQRWFSPQAFDLAGITNTVGAPFLAFFLRRVGVGNAGAERG